MGVETPAGAKGKTSAGRGAVDAKTGNQSKTQPAQPPVRQFANQLQQDIEDVTVEVNQLVAFFSFFTLPLFRYKSKHTLY